MLLHETTCTDATARVLLSLSREAFAPATSIETLRDRYPRAHHYLPFSNIRVSLHILVLVSLRYLYITAHEERPPLTDSPRQRNLPDSYQSRRIRPPIETSHRGLRYSLNNRESTRNLEAMRFPSTPALIEGETCFRRSAPNVHTRGAPASISSHPPPLF